MLRATAVTWLVATLIMPISYWQHGRAGVVVVVAAAATIVLSLWMAAWLTKALTHAGRATAGMLAATGLRMALPLALALVLVVGRGHYVPVETAIYLVPIYLSALSADTLFALRRPSGKAVASPGSARPLDVSQG